mmetsp:Transcript_26940/g.67608  ORF Transcript_26940/g.67608 Transcript_26940/m.67608 type:complete len:98 (+) Transcript_26940:121-414(+)
MLDDSGDRLCRGMALQRKAWCHMVVKEYDTALLHYNSALCCFSASDTDNIKELFYNRAYCKNEKGDFLVPLTTTHLSGSASALFQPRRRKSKNFKSS